MSLSPRQTRGYVDRCDIYSVAQTTDVSTGRRTAKTYTLSASDVPCYFMIRQSVEAANGSGFRIEEDNIFTRDEIHFGADVVVDSDYVIKNTSVNTIDGSDTLNTGRYWIVAGQPKSISQRGRRRADKRVVEAIQIEADAKPTGVG